MAITLRALKMFIILLNQREIRREQTSDRAKIKYSSNRRQGSGWQLELGIDSGNDEYLKLTLICAIREGGKTTGNNTRNVPFVELKEKKCPEAPASP